MKKEIMRQFELSKLKNATQDNVIQDKSLSQGFKNGGIVPAVTEHIDTKQIWNKSKPSDILDKVASFRAAKLAGKKVLGAIPFLGAGVAALQGNTAQAAEELAGDVPVVGQAFEAIKPETSGPAAGTLDSRIENGKLTDEDRLQMKKEALQNIR